MYVSGSGWDRVPPLVSFNTTMKNVGGNIKHDVCSFQNLTLHFLQVFWMTAAALFHLWTCFLTSQDRTAAGSTKHIQDSTYD